MSYLEWGGGVAGWGGGWVCKYPVCRVAPGGGQITQQALPAINGGGMAKRIPEGRSECSIANCRPEYSTGKYFHTTPPPQVGVLLGKFWDLDQT